MGPGGSLKRNLRSVRTNWRTWKRLARVEAIEERQEAYRRIRVEKCPDLMLPQICNRPSKTNSNVKLTKLISKKRRKTFQEEKGLHRPERRTGLWQTGSTTHSHDIYQSMTPAVRIVLLCFTLLLLWQNAVTREWSKNSLKTNRTNLRTLKTDSVGSRQSRNGKKVTGVCEWRSPLVWTLRGLVWKTKRYRRSELRPRAATVLEQAIQERLLHETIRKEINWALYICVGQNGRGRYFSSGLLRPGPIQCKGKGKRKGKGKQKGRSSGKQERPIL